MGRKKGRANGDGDVWPRKNREGKVIGYRGSYWAPTPDGPKRRYVSGKNKTEARNALNKAKADADSVPIFDTGKLTVGEYLDHWLADCVKPLVDQGKMEHSTYVRYAGFVRNHIKPTPVGRKKLKHLRRAEVRRLYNRKAKELSPRSVDYLHVTLQKALNQAIRDDLLLRNVAAGERPRTSRDRDEATALSPDEVRRLLAAARGQRNEALYAVALHTGLRQGELLGLKWTDVELDSPTGRLSVSRALKVTENGLGFGPPKNKASQRSVPLNKTAAAALRAHKARQNKETLAAPGWRDLGLVFPNRLGGPMDHNNLYHRHYKPLLKSAGLEGEGLTFHALRHTFATALFKRGEHPKVIQALLGHSSITQTMDTYSHLIEDIGGDAVGGLDEAFG